MTTENRLLRLERVNRRWRWLAVALGLLLLAQVSCSQDSYGPSSAERNTAYAAGGSGNAVFNNIKVRSLEVVNDQGQGVGGFSGIGDGAHFVVRRTDGEGYIAIQTVLDPSVLVRNAAGSTKLTGAQIELGFTDPAKLRAYQVASKAVLNGAPLDRQKTAILNRGHDDPLVTIGATTGRGGIIDVYNSLGRKAVSVQANNGNEGLVTLHDVNGTVSNALSVRRN